MDLGCGESFMKIAHITTVDISLRAFLLNHLRGLRQAGYAVTAISSSGPNVPVIEAAGVRHIPVAMARRAFSPLSDLRSLWNLYRTLRREQFSIVHTYTPKAGILGRIAARLAGVPIVVHTSFAFVFSEGSPWLWRWFFTWLERIAAWCSDLFFAGNREDYETALRWHIVASDKIKLLDGGGVGVDLARFNREHLSLDGLTRQRREIGLPDGVPVIGFVGRLVREKGLLELFEAVRRVREQLHEVRLLIVGPTDREKADAVAPEVAAQYAIADICIFAGMRQDIHAWYPLMDVLVLPSYREGFGMVLAEAAAMGIPVIASNIRGCREAVEHGRSGFLVPPGDVPILADTILDLLTHPDKARARGEEGRRMAQERFDQQRVITQVRTEYARLLRAKGLQVPQTE
jgi:glycosyltransferase involved in cell wall biosynthesis